MVSDELKAQILEEKDALVRSHAGDKTRVSIRHADEWKAQRAKYTEAAEAVREEAKDKNLILQAKHGAEWLELKEAQRTARNMLKKKHAALRAKETS